MGNKLQQYLEKSQEYDLVKTDEQHKPTQIELDEQCRVVLPSKPVPLGELFAKVADGVSVERETDRTHTLSDHALDQMRQVLSPAVFKGGSSRTIPKPYLDAIPADLRATILRRHITDWKYSDRKKWLFRLADGEVRALLSQHYAPVDNTPLLERLIEIVEGDPELEANMRSHFGFVNRDNMGMRLTFKELPGGVKDTGSYGVGLYVGNDETGRKSVTVYPLIQRNSCANSIIVAEGMSLRHSHRGNPQTILNMAKATMTAALTGSAAAYQRILRAEDQKLENLSAVISHLAKEYNWADEIKDRANVGTEGQHTRMGVVNAVTYAAQGFEDEDERVRMERLGGSILVDDRMFRRLQRVEVR